MGSLVDGGGVGAAWSWYILGRKWGAVMGRTQEKPFSFFVLHFFSCIFSFYFSSSFLNALHDFKPFFTDLLSSLLLVLAWFRY